MLTVKLNRVALSRLGISVADVQAIIEIAVGGKDAGTVFEGDRRIELVVRLPERLRTDMEAIRSLPVPLAQESIPAPLRATLGNAPLANVRYVPLSAVAEIEIAPGPNQISRETQVPRRGGVPMCADAISAPSSRRHSSRWGGR